VDSFLTYVEKYKFAILGTVLFHVVFFFYFNFKTIERPFKFPDPEVEIALPLEDVEFDPEIMEQLEKLKDNQVSEEVYNLASDANDTREKSYENFSTQELDEQVENEARNLEQQYFNEWAATHDNGESGDNGSSADIEMDNDKETKSQNDVDKSTINTGGSKSFAGEVMVSYKLDNRKAHSLPKPGYTCNSTGTVVIDVKVDKSGSVKSATYNASLSRSASECMIDKAIRYAKKSRFNFSSSSPGSQSGTITYKFVSK
jgi:archaellum component FlaC